MFERGWKPGDWVIYRLSKYGVAPGPRAHHISASRKGESYNYIVDKFWVIEGVGPAGELHVRTPGGKTRTISSDDPNLRRARWWHRFLWGERFRTADLKCRERDSVQENPQRGPAEAA